MVAWYSRAIFVTADPARVVVGVDRGWPRKTYGAANASVGVRRAARIAG
jgi:hypothetical protein